MGQARRAGCQGMREAEFEGNSLYLLVSESRSFPFAIFGFPFRFPFEFGWLSCFPYKLPLISLKWSTVSFACSLFLECACAWGTWFVSHTSTHTHTHSLSLSLCMCVYIYVCVCARVYRVRVCVCVCLFSQVLLTWPVMPQPIARSSCSCRRNIMC